MQPKAKGKEKTAEDKPAPVRSLRLLRKQLEEEVKNFKKEVFALSESDRKSEEDSLPGKSTRSWGKAKPAKSPPPKGKSATPTARGKKAAEEEEDQSSGEESSTSEAPKSKNTNAEQMERTNHIMRARRRAPTGAEHDALSKLQRAKRGLDQLYGERKTALVAGLAEESPVVAGIDARLAKYAKIHAQLQEEDDRDLFEG